MGTLLLLACLCTLPAHAAEESGEGNYLWYVEGHGTLYLSIDGGISYGELPGLREAQEKTGQDYAYTTSVFPLPGGGVRVTARDRWGTEDSFRRDYSAAELAATLAKADPTNNIRVLCTNGQGMTLAVRLVYTTENAPYTGDIMADWRYPQEAYQLLYSTDGVTWQEQPWPEGLNSAEEAWWDGENFYIYDGMNSSYHGGGTLVSYVDVYACSPDGLHWTTEEGEYDGDPAISSWDIGAVVGPYRFERYEGEVYLLKKDDWSTGVLLPHMGEEMRAQGLTIEDLKAWYGPDDTVFVAAYGTGPGIRSFSLEYPVSSLDWCLENLSAPFREPEDFVWNDPVALATAGEYIPCFHVTQRELLRNDGSGWKRVEKVPFKAKFSLLDHNGKDFMVTDQSTGLLYFSEDGLTWTGTDAVRPADWKAGAFNRIECAAAWTGEGYILSRKAWEHKHGIMGAGGGTWFMDNTRVFFLDENLRLTDTYDFGRLVEDVGYWNGAYYAQVANSEGLTQQGWGWEDEEGYFDGRLGSTLDRSTDGRTWTALESEYLNTEKIMIRQRGGEKRGNLPTNDPAKPLRCVAQLDRWRFILYDRYEGHIDVYLMRDNANDMTYLGLEEEIRSRWITPGSLTAAYTLDGKVEVTVTDLSTPSMKYSVTYTPEELDSWKTGDHNLVYRGLYYVDEQRGDGVDVGLLELINGEKELCYRDGTTAGKYMYLDSVPWSNSVELLPYSGKDFMLLDKADGKVYLSSDGKTWREAAGEWMVRNRAYDAWHYAFLWTGDHYVGICLLAEDSGDGSHSVSWREWKKESKQVLLLDEDLNVLGTTDFVTYTTSLGYRDGVCWVNVAERLYRSYDGGRTWEETDIGQVRECLRKQKA